MGCIPWLKPIIIMANRKTIRLTIPYLNNAEHLRFDFTHFSPLSDDEIARVEKIVNEKIAQDLPVVTKVMSMEEAKKTGAMALFGEKYGDEVRVVSMGDFSVELCGGTHVKNTGAITAFKILSETGVASGVRRIEAVTDQGVFNYYHKQEEELKEAAKALKATPATLLTRIESLLAEVKELKSENESLKSKLAKDALGDVMDQVEEVKGVKLLATSIEDVDMNGLRELGDNLKEKLGEGVIVLASQKDGKVFLVAMVCHTWDTRSRSHGCRRACRTRSVRRLSHVCTPLSPCGRCRRTVPRARYAPAPFPIRPSWQHRRCASS